MIATKYYKLNFESRLSHFNIHPSLFRPTSTSHLHKLAAAPPLNLNHPLLSKLNSSPTPTQFNQIHAQIITVGLSRNAFAASRLLKLTASSTPPDLPLTHLIFSQIHHPDLYSYNLLIKALSNSPHPLKSFSFYHSLLHQGLHPNEYTHCFLLGCCSRALALREGRQLHAHLAKHGFDSTTFSTTSLVHMYGDCRALDDAHRAFGQIRHRSSASWGTIIDACISQGGFTHGLRLFTQMLCSGVEPSNATFVSIVHACAVLGDVFVGRALHGYIAVRGVQLNATLGTSLVDMYSKCGAIEVATKVFSAMPVKGIESLNCLIHGLAVNGEGPRAVGLFAVMKHELGFSPNEVSFIGLLNACSHAGLVEEGIRYFSEMKRVYGIRPSIKHYGCLVDLFGRAGRVKEAMEVMRTMPMKPDAMIWGALFSACRTRGLTGLAELVAAQIIKVAPHDTCGYLLLSDAYAMGRLWDDVVVVRKMMVEVDIRKLPGFSSISN